MKRSAELKPAPAARTMLFANVVPNGSGGFAIVPQKPTEEIDSRQVGLLLNCARATLSNIVNSTQGQKYLRWRWLTEKQGKRVFELDSVIAYREASKDSEFGG